jgi:hypothetical protein
LVKVVIGCIRVVIRGLGRVEDPDLIRVSDLDSCSIGRDSAGVFFKPLDVLSHYNKDQDPER